jgi:hypothetical protein
MLLVATMQAIRRFEPGTFEAGLFTPGIYVHLSTQIMRDVSVAEILVMIVDKR